MITFPPFCKYLLETTVNVFVSFFWSMSIFVREQMVSHQKVQSEKKLLVGFVFMRFIENKVHYWHNPLNVVFLLLVCFDKLVIVWPFEERTFCF